MGSSVGLTTRLCIGVESTYGTVNLASPQFIEFDSESLEAKFERIRSNALGSGNLQGRRGSRSVETARWGEGSIDMEVTKNGMGKLVRNAIGGTPTIAQQGATTAWLQTHSLGSVLGKSLSIQKQNRDESDVVVKQETFHGCKFPSVEFKLDKKGKLMLSVSVDAEDVDTSTAVATPALTATSVFHARQAAVTVNGVAGSLIEALSVKFDRALDTDRYHAGNAGVKAEPLINDFPTVTGSITTEFAASTYYDLFVADTPVPFVVTFTGSVISGAFNELFRITIPEIRFTGESPKTSGPGLTKLTMPFEAQWNGVDALIKVEIQSTDTAI